MDFAPAGVGCALGGIAAGGTSDLGASVVGTGTGVTGTIWVSPAGTGSRVAGEFRIGVFSDDAEGFTGLTV